MSDERGTSITTGISIHRIQKFLDEGAYIQQGSQVGVIQFAVEGTTWGNGKTDFTLFLENREIAQQASDLFRNLSRLIDGEILANEDWKK
jgi:hypothetical protein